MKRLALATIASLSMAVIGSAWPADETVTRLIPLKYVSAQLAAAALTKGSGVGEGLPGSGELEAGRKDFLQRAFADATRGLRAPRNLAENAVYPLSERHYAEVRIAQAPGDEGGGLSSLLPEGVTIKSIAVPDQNALLVRGTPSAVDQVQELIRLIDKPAKQVNVACKLLSLGLRTARQWGADLAWRLPNGDLFVQGPAPGGPTMRFARGDVTALLAGNVQRSVSNNSVEANVTTTNNTPAVIRAATIIPFVTASVTYDQFGQRQVDYIIDAVATGVELFVVPRINGDDTVTMLLRPSFITATGSVITPDGQALPITQNTSVETQVTVPDGETLVIGGLPTRNDALETLGVPIIMRQTRTSEETQSLILVRPHIIRTPPER